jgi:acetoin utilization deacetylase AcuC-like enzyme
VEADVTGFLYDPLFLEHETGEHPENADRLRPVFALLQQEGIWSELTHLSPRPASLDALHAVHEPGYVRFLEQVAASGGGWLTADTVMSARSFDVARLAAGAAVRGVEAVLSGEVAAAFSLGRPPGHHARPSAGMGFCLFNSAAVAAREAVRRLGVERVFLLDFDVHHGNGTQEIFYDDERIFYASLHQSPAYPGTGALEEIGAGAGSGFTANLPLPAGLGDTTYLRAFDDLLAPLARRFRPDLILVSAGYDAHWSNGRYLSSIEMNVTVDGFAGMVARLRDWAAELCGGRIAFVLEGGYDPAALAASVLATLRVLRDESYADPFAPPTLPPAPDLSGLWSRFREIHRI